MERGLIARTCEESAGRTGATRFVEVETTVRSARRLSRREQQVRRAS